MNSQAAALLYWKQLLNELGTSPYRGGGDPVGSAKAGQRSDSLIELYFSLLRVIGATTHFEIGAHFAETSRRFVEEDEARKAFAYEANPTVRDRYLAEHAHERITYIDKAIGSAEGPVTFYAPKARRREIWGSLRKRHKFRFVDEITVDLIKLDTAWKQAKLKSANHKAGLWIDVEGTALDVIESGPNTLKKQVGLIFTEVNDVAAYEGSATSLAVFAQLMDWGFLPLARDNEWHDAWNVIFVHESQMAAVQTTYTTWHYQEARRIFGAG